MKMASTMMAAGGLGLLGAAVACATTDGSVDVSDDSAYKLDAAVAEEASVDAGGGGDDGGGPVRCSSSGLCIAPTPLDEGVTVMSIAGSSASDVWAVGAKRAVLHFDGSDWARVDVEDEVPTLMTIPYVWVGSASDVWVADPVALRRTTGWRGAGGTEWSRSTALDSVSAVVGRSGAVLVGHRTTDALEQRVVSVCDGWGDDGPSGCVGLTSNFLSYSGSGAVTGVGAMAATRADEAWATLVNGARVTRIHAVAADGGSPWVVTDFDSRTVQTLHSIWGNDDVVWLVGDGGTIRRLERENLASLVFDVVPNIVTSNLRAVYGFSKDDVWIVGDDATVLHWDGQAWSRLTTPFDALDDKPDFTSVWGAGPNNVWIGGREAMLHYEGLTP